MPKIITPGKESSKIDWLTRFAVAVKIWDGRSMSPKVETGFVNMVIVKKSKNMYVTVRTGRGYSSIIPLPFYSLDRMIRIRKRLKPIRHVVAQKNRFKENDIAVKHWEDVFNGERATKESLKEMEKVEEDI